MAYYKACQSKSEAEDAATHIRKPGNTPRGYSYPINAVVQPVRNSRGQWLWGIYYYQK